MIFKENWGHWKPMLGPADIRRHKKAHKDKEKLNAAKPKDEAVEKPDPPSADGKHAEIIEKMENFCRFYSRGVCGKQLYDVLAIVHVDDWNQLSVHNSEIPSIDLEVYNKGADGSLNIGLLFTGDMER